MKPTLALADVLRPGSRVFSAVPGSGFQGLLEQVNQNRDVREMTRSGCVSAPSPLEAAGFLPVPSTQEMTV
jgi:hypothetical protein